MGKAGPAPSAGFVKSAYLSQRDDLPFQKAWIRRGVDFRKYHEIYLPPVNTEHLLKMNWWEGTGHAAKVKEDIRDFAIFTRDTLERAYWSDPKHSFRVVRSPSEDTLVLEFAIVELIPTKAALKAAGFIPPVAIPMSLIGLNTRSTVAFEARLRDGYSGEILALFADREAAQVSILNVRDYTWYSHARSIVEVWANQFIQVLTRAPDEAIKDSPWFELKPW